MLAPRARVAFLMNPSTPQEIETAFAAMSRGKAGAVIVQGDGFFIRQPLLIGADKVIK